MDLTGPLEDAMWAYPPPVPSVRIVRAAAIEEVGYEVHHICCASISATYLEASAHLIRGGRTIDTVSPGEMIRPAFVARIPKARTEAITADDLRRAARDHRPGEALVVATGWERQWGTVDFITGSPYFTPEAMAWIVARRPPILGGDMPSFDDPAHPRGVNQTLFASGALILAPLVNLLALTAERVQLFAFPLKIVGSSGSPCRVLALEGSGT